MLALCTAADERERCCVLRDGHRCDQQTAWRFSEPQADGKGFPDNETELYTYTCGDCALAVGAMLGSNYIAERVAHAARQSAEYVPPAEVTPFWRVR